MYWYSRLLGHIRILAPLLFLSLPFFDTKEHLFICLELAKILSPQRNLPFYLPPSG